MIRSDVVAEEPGVAVRGVASRQRAAISAFHASLVAVRFSRVLLASLLVAACGETVEPPSSAEPVNEERLNIEGELKSQEPQQRVRGVVLIVIDTLRADHLGCYGSDKGLTPRLDDLARSSLVFRNTVAASSWTRPSVASIFMGQYPTTIDVLTRQDSLSAHLVTLAESLTARDARCFGISANRNAGSNFGFDQGFEGWYSEMPRVGYPGGFTMVPAEEVTKQGLACMDTLSPDESFFLFLHYVDPHDPYMPHPELRKKELAPGRFDGSREGLKKLSAIGRKGRTAADMERIRGLYAEEVAYTDLWLGELFDGLESRGLLEQSMLVVTADHGEGLWDHDVRSHGTDLYEGQIQVPLILRMPREVAPVARDVLNFASHVDIAPTIKGALGLPVLAVTQGRDLWRAEREGTLGKDWLGYSELRYASLDLESLSNGRQKLIHNRTYDREGGGTFEYTVRKVESMRQLSSKMYGEQSYAERILAANRNLFPEGATVDSAVPIKGMVLQLPARDRDPKDDLFELYHLGKDPHELRDLSRKGEGREANLYESLRAIGAWNESQRVAGEGITTDQLDEQTLQELRALGYLGEDE